MSYDEQGNDEPEPQSGPFCRHFVSPPSDCGDRCAACGHPCPEHDENGVCENAVAEGGDAIDDECDCPGWQDEPF